MHLEGTNSPLLNRSDTIGPKETRAWTFCTNTNSAFCFGHNSLRLDKRKELNPLMTSSPRGHRELATQKQRTHPASWRLTKGRRRPKAVHRTISLARLLSGLAIGLCLPFTVIYHAWQSPPVHAAATELFFSEYIEGSGFNKALEIYNGTGAPVDLGAGNYVLQLYSNGSPTVSQSVNLTGSSPMGMCLL